MDSFNIISLSDTPWDKAWMNRQQILSRLGKSHNILYSNGIYHTWQIGSEEWRHAPFLAQFSTKDSVKHHIRGKFPLRNNRFDLFDRIALNNEIAKWKKQFVFYNEKSITYIWGLGFKKYINGIGSNRLIYHVYDLFEKYPGWNKQKEFEHHWLLDHADLVVASSEYLMTHLEKISKRKVLLLENGVDYLEFSRQDLVVPNDLQNIPRPIIMYVGNLNRKVDLSLVDEISIVKPEWHWVFVGNIGSFDNNDMTVLDKLKNRDNVHFVGSRPVQELPAYEVHADINVMIYKDDISFWTVGGYPLKLNEYLAAGKPVISSYLPSLRKYDELIQIVKGRDGWISAIDSVVNGEYVNSLTSMQKVAKNNDWEIKVSQLDLWLRGLFPDV